MDIFTRLTRWLTRPSANFRHTDAHLQALHDEHPDKRLVAQYGLQRIEGLRLPNGRMRLALNASCALQPRNDLSGLLTTRSLEFSAEEGAFCRDFPVHHADERRAFVAALEDLLATFGGMPKDGVYSVHLEEERELLNEDLRKSMGKLARLRDQRSRTELYQQLLSASLYLPVEWTGTRLEIAHPEQLQGEAVWCGFTHDEAFADWSRTKPAGRLRIHMLQLLREGVQRRIASLKLNPDHTVGGELYRNELQVLARAAGETITKTIGV